jgi:heptosyltransferase I
MARRSTIPLSELTPRRICLIKPSALGDIVQTMPVLSVLRRRWPRAHIAWVVNRGLAGVLRGHDELDDVIEFDRSARSGRQVLVLAGLLRRLRRERFDLAIDLQGLLRSGLMARATGAARRVGFANAREGAVLAYTDRVSAVWEMPNWRRYGLIAQALGCGSELPPARLPIKPEHHDFARRELAGLPRPLLAIHPGAQWETKRWPPGHFAELARLAQQEFGAGIVLVGGPGEGPLCRQIAADLTGPVVDISERTGLLELAAVCAAADVFLSGDTGPMHLAAAAGTPAVSVFTCTSPLQSGPRDNEHLITATGVDCAASFRTRCPHLSCMNELTPPRVWPKLHVALAACVSKRDAG